VPPILQALKSLPPLIAAASRTSAPDLAVTLLKQLQLPLSSSATTTTTTAASTKRAYDVFDHLQIFPGDKRQHFTKLHKATGIAYEEMLFFDDEGRNRNVEQLGVCFWLVVDGVTRAEVDRGVQEWRRRRKMVARGGDGEGGADGAVYGG